MNIENICLAHTIRRADRVVSQYYNEHLAPVGLRITQFTVLHAINLLSQVTARELQDAMVIEQATISRALKPLIRDGYILELEGTDKRQKLLSLTKKGAELHADASKLWRAAQAKFREHLGDGRDSDLIMMSRHIVSLKDGKTV